jgi:ADP-heptose:LPS heptosyltransferase
MKVLVSAYTGLGNFILKTPVISKIKELWPDAEIDLIAGNSFGTEFVLKNTKFINETHILKMDATLMVKLKFFFSLRKKQYDTVFLPFDAVPKFLMLGALLLTGIKFTHINLNLNQNIKQKIRNFIYLFGLPGFRFVPVLQGRHETDLNYDLLEAFYNQPMERTYQTFIAQKDDSAVLKRFDIEPKQYIVIQPTAANGFLTAKVWAPDNFEELVSRINQLYPDLRVVFVGDQGDLDSIKQTSLVNIKGVVNTMGQTSIAELSTIINNAAIVIAHDSGVMHIANALKVNLIALYGPTDYTRTRPLGQNSRILYSKNECFAALYNFGASESDLAERYPDYYCMSGITVDDVIKQIGLAMK